MYSGEENGGQSARDGALLDEVGSPAFCVCFTRMFIYIMERVSDTASIEIDIITKNSIQ